MCSLKLHNLNGQTIYLHEVEGLVTVLGIPDFLFLVIQKNIFRKGWHLAMLNKKRCFKRLICPLHYGILPTKGHVQSSNSFVKERVSLVPDICLEICLSMRERKREQTTKRRKRVASLALSNAGKIFKKNLWNQGRIHHPSPIDPILWPDSF